jgi:hypothetical protein
VAAHRELVGNWCPGWADREPHPAADLTADHAIPVSKGGLHGPLVVRCRRCNSARGARAA